MADWLTTSAAWRLQMQKSQSSTFSLLPSTPSLPPLAWSPVSVQSLLRLPNGDESRRYVRDLTTPHHKSGKPVHQHQPWMKWVNGISTLQIVGESVVWGPEISLWLRTLCPDTCCSRFIHLYPPQVGSWLPEPAKHRFSARTHLKGHARDYIGALCNGWAF